jgi:hypothetical protein
MDATAGSNLKLLYFLHIAIILLLPGCKPPPSEQALKDLIAKHFETEKYHMLGIKLGDIKSVPLGEKTYMGTPGYQVDIESITLEIRQDIGKPILYRAGQKITFTNARIRIRERPGQAGTWILSNISGIPLP